ncbi:hypothetical protein MMC24_002216 [Lignoscripta atroalba]|nr:hypothetical protein [Lignoscripta atroalba]
MTLKAVSTGKVVDAVHVDSNSTRLRPVAPIDSASGDATAMNPGQFDLHADFERMKAFSSYAMDLVKDQKKDIDRILKSVEQLQLEMTLVRGTLDSRNASALARGPSLGTMGKDPPSGDAQGLGDDVQYLTERLSEISSKANEVDGLRLELDMMKRRVKRLEEGNVGKQSSPISNSKPMESPTIHQAARMTGPLARRSMPLKKLATSTTAPSILPDLPKHKGISKKTAPFKFSANDTSMTEGRSSSSSSSSSTNSNQQSDAVTQPAISSASKFSQQRVALEDLGPGEIDTDPILPAITDSRPLEDLGVTTYDPNDTEYLPSGRSSIGNTQATLDTVEILDSDYHPRNRSFSSPRVRGGLRGRGRGRGRGLRKSWNVRLPTPEWEKPDWKGPSSIPASNSIADHTLLSSSRGRLIMRRGLSGSGFPSGPAMNRRKSTERPSFLTDGKLRDAEGFLLKPDGTRDGRSLNTKPRKKQPSAAEIDSEMGAHEKLMRQIFPNRVGKPRVLDNGGLKSNGNGEAQGALNIGDTVMHGI